jgi:hypothetical protein
MAHRAIRTLVAVPSPSCHAIRNPSGDLRRIAEALHSQSRQSLNVADPRGRDELGSPSMLFAVLAQSVELFDEQLRRHRLRA